ncbi:MAG: bifunctional metallophosphatase/5'-nucleotidase [Candidatus Brocadia sp. UTAMX2]|jgi:5'-nucleotidase|nr:MAG: bifunctional metallophosphatase/5'-nucleotidase [Candidatus Brocadia sp. UTAMX2]
MKTKTFAILHSNDMYGHFFQEIQSDRGESIGGMALLSGYINEVRKEEENVFYVISGDMIQGSLLDAEYKGISTVEIINYLAPDVVCLDNHEFDYSLPHLLFLEKVANFPIVNANIYVKKNYRRLMQPYVIINKAGFDILFIGIITESVMNAFSRDKFIGSFITLEEACAEVDKITNTYKNDDIDLTILLTHIGFESDLRLAKMLKPEWGVDMIIGGHSRTVLEKPARVNNILIAQAGEGTNQIGRFDIIVDDNTNSVVDYTWQLVPINNNTAEPDSALMEYIESYNNACNRKYSTLLCKLSHKLTHPQRTIETSLGNLITDILGEIAGCDVMLVASGAIRLKELGPLVTLGDLIACFPYDESVTRFSIKGSQLKKIFEHIMRPANRNGEGECYQISKGVQAIYNDFTKRLESLTITGTPIDEMQLYSICLMEYSVTNCSRLLNITESELHHAGKSKVVSTSVREVIEEYLRNHQNIVKKIEGRLVYKNSP